ncbi:MAG: hypothetical protein IJW28_02295, partial [Clostridia bacterium]|nr:hypothetical protein [Clostridia bacterium]
YYDVNTADNVYSVIRYFGSSHNDLRINFNKLGTTNYSNSLDIKTDKLAWNYDIDIDTSTKTVIVDADKDIIVFKISKGNEASKLHRYDSTATNNEYILLNNDTHYNYIVALNNNNEPCLYRIISNSVSDTPIINFTSRNTDTYIDKISLDQSELVIITYAYDSASERLDIVFKVCKSNLIELSNNDRIGKVNALDISRISIAKDTSSTGKLSINDYYMDIFILNVSPTATNLVATSGHYYTGDFNNSALSFNASTQTAYAILCDAVTKNPGIFRYNHATRSWINLNIPMTETTEQMFIDSFTLNEDNISIALYYTYDATNNKFTNLSFSKLNYHDTTANVMTLEKGLEPSDTSVNAGFKQVSNDNLSIRYYSINNLLQGNAQYSPIYFVKAPNGALTRYDNTADFATRFDSINALYTMSRDKVVENYTLNKYVIDKSVNNNGTDDDETDDIISYTTGSFSANIDFSGSTYETLYYHFPDGDDSTPDNLTYDQFISRLFSYTIAHLSGLDANHKPYIYSSVGGLFTIRGFSGSLTPNIYLVKRADNPTTLYVYNGSELNATYNETDEIYILSSSTRYDVKLLQYEFDFGVSNAISLIATPITSGDLYDAAYALTTAEDREMLPTTAVVANNNPFSTSIFDQNYYLNYIPSNGKVTALIINKKDNTKRFFDAEPFLNNVPFSLTDNLLFIFTTEMFSYKVWYYYENHGLLTASQLTLGKNQTNKIERLNNAYIKYTVGNNYYDIEFNVYITTNSSTDFASTQNISTNYLASQTMVTLNNQNKFTMPEYSVLLVGINTLSNELVNKITTFADNVEFDIDNNYYYLVAGNPTKTELYIYKLTYNTTNSNFEWAEVGFFNTSADSGIIDDTAFYQKISYNLDVNDKIRTIRFTAYANKSDTTSLTTYYKVFYNANDLDVSKTEIIHNKSGYYNINTTAHTLTTNEIYSARFLVLTYNDGVLNNVKVNTITKGELSLAPNQKLYVILNTTTGTDIYPALFTIDFSTSITTSLRYVNITTEPVSHTIELELADDELYFEDNGLFIIYKFTTADSIQVNFVDMDTSHTTYTNFENKDFNPKNETVTPKITISDGVVSLESPSPLSFVVIDKKEYKTTEIFEMSNGSFEYNSVTQILYTFRIEAYTPEGAEEPIDILNLYRYDFSSPDVNFPFKKVATLDIDTTVTDVTTVEEEDYYEYCDIDYYEDIYTIVKYVCTADFKLVISFAKLYPAFVNIGGYFSGVGNEAQIVEIIGIPYSYSNNNNGQYSLIIRPGSLAEVVNLNFTTRVGVKPIVYTVDDVEYTTYVTYSLSLDTTGLYLNVKYVLGYMEIYEGTKQSISHVGSGSGENTNPEYGSITEKVTYQKIHQPIPSDTNIEEFNNLIRYVGTDLSSTQDNLIKYYTSETTSPIESSVNIDIFGLKNYYNLPNAETDNGYAEMKYNDVNEGIEYISDVTKVYINANANYDNNTYNNDTPISPDFLSELLGEGQITKNEDGLITAKTADIDPNAPFSLNNLIITNVTPTFWTYLCNFLYDSSNKISQSLIYKYDYDLVYDEWGTLKQLSYDSSEYNTYYLTKDTEINDDGLYQIIVKYTYNKYKYLDENTNVIDGENVVFYQLFTFIVNNNTPTLTISVGDDTNGYNLIGTSNYTNKGVKISWVATTEFQNYEYISITNSNFDGTVNFVSTYNPIDMEISTVGNSDMANSITKFSYDEDLKSYVVTINDSEAFSTNGAYKVRLHYGVNQSSYSTYSFNIDTEQITGLRLYEASMDENNLYYATKELRESNTPIQIVNQPFTLAFNQKSSGAKIYALYYKLTLNQSNDYSQLLNTVIGTQDYTTVTTNFIADGTLNTTNQSFIYNYKYNVEGVGDYISSQCYINPSKPTIYMFYLYDNAGNSCRYFVFYDITTPKYIISPELK